MQQKKHSYLSLMIVFVLAAVCLLYSNGQFSHKIASSAFERATDQASSASRLSDAFQRHESGFEVQVTVPVFKVLADDQEGSRHQRFLIKMPTGQTILVSHNIDLAQRVEGLSAGDVVTIQGEYEWNDKGGVIHWTHHDPRGAHPGGWIERDGKRYE